MVLRNTSICKGSWKAVVEFCQSPYPWLLALAGLVFGLVPAAHLHAQALGWEGETGVFVTPLAYTASAEGQKVHAVVAYHYFNAGPVIGEFHEVSTEVGLGKRLELGYTHEFHNEGVYPFLNPLWHNVFEIFNGKAILVQENYKKHNSIPAISVGFIARTGVRNVGDYLTYNNTRNNGKKNGDIYIVASKIVTQVAKKMPLVLNAGVRGTNAELWGMGGNAPNWQARPFGAVAFVFTGPRRSTIIVGSEAAMQPHHPLGFTSLTDIGKLPLNIPTTLTYCARILPSPKHKLNIDFGVAQVAGVIYGSGPTGINLKARHQFGAQVTYGF
jgi:hypothetical protein